MYTKQDKVGVTRHRGWNPKTLATQLVRNTKVHGSEQWTVEFVSSFLSID